LAGVVIYFFFATAIGIFLATIARTMPQGGVLYLLVATPMNILSGSNTPLESMPRLLQIVMQALPSTHSVSFAQAGAGLDVVWPEFLAVALMGSLFFSLAVFRFRGVSAQTT
jgi:ABC-2 type transport system permease protein